jgi:hypothetical protein
MGGCEAPGGPLVEVRLAIFYLISAQCQLEPGELLIRSFAESAFVLPAILSNGSFSSFSFILLRRE